MIGSAKHMERATTGFNKVLPQCLKTKAMVSVATRNLIDSIAIEQQMNSHLMAHYGRQLKPKIASLLNRKRPHISLMS